jgi:starvation-inducible DNA-binding protein
MIRQLVAGQEAVARTARAAFKVADAADDQPTADLLTQRMEVHEKNAWMLRSLLEDGGAAEAAPKALRRRKK